MFLVDGEEQEAQLTYRELDCKARAIGALFQSLNAVGERVLLLFPPGLDYIAAFFGCLYGETIAVPAYPPRRPRTERNTPRIHAIVNDSQPSIVLTTSSMSAVFKSVLAHIPNLPEMRWIETDKVAGGLADQWREKPIDSDSLAFLQYTSGSTSTPKGVMVSHRNLLHNERLIKVCFRQTDRSRIVGWLPLYHDMGLIGNVLQPLYVGAPCILMSPTSFLQRPLRWLQAISKYRATTSGGPNFAYDLCVRKISPEQRKNLDLSSWTTAFNGAEPIRIETLERFASAYEPCGFRREAFSLCYGLAESTLIVSGGAKPHSKLSQVVQAAAIEQNKIILADEQDKCARTLVSCGRPALDLKIVIVDPKSLTLCPPDEIGEIWVSGPSVTQGYWNQPQQTARTFHAYLADTGEGPFLRTGDLGFLKDGELFVTSRLKDLIIIRGRNLYPHDIELIVERSHPSLRQGSGAVFSVEVGGEERLVVVQEVEYRRQPEVIEVIESIRQVITEEYEAQAYAIALIKPGTISKTSSGKIQRHECKLKFQAGSLDLVAEWRMAGQAPESVDSAFEFAVPLQDSGAIEKWLTARLAAKLGMNATEIDVSRPLIRYGIDSMMTIEFAHEIETKFNMILPPASILGTSVVAIAAKVSSHIAKGSDGAEARPVPAEDLTADHPLSFGQQSIWFLHQLDPESAAYNLANAARIQSELDVQALRRSFQALVDRHACLRTNFVTLQGGKTVQRVHAYAEACFEEVNASVSSEAEFIDYLMREAIRTFNLEQDSLLRVKLFKRSSQEYVLLLVLHHIIADFWSLAVIMNELGIIYAAESAGARGHLAPFTFQYIDYVHWQAELLASSKGNELYIYWKNQLSGELPALNLPTDRPRPPVQTYRGASQPFQVNDKITDALKAVCRSREATIFMGLLASFQMLLHRYTGQEDLLVGSPISGRNRADLAGLVGYFVNPIALRADFSADPTAEEFLDQVRRAVLAAFDHQDYPFSLLVERLQPNRDPSRSPVLQAMLSFQKAPLLNEEGLTLFALGEAGAKIQLGGLSIESMALRQRVALFDLTLAVTEVDKGLIASIEYNTDLFDAAMIKRMIAHFCALLEEVAANPSMQISALPLLTKSERQQMLVEWNDTSNDYPRNKCLHELFEEQVERSPESIALVYQDNQLSYLELNRRANRLAHYIQRLGVGPEKRVGIFIERSIEMMVELLGALKAGGAYVPLDPTYPRERLSLMLEGAGITVLLTQRRLLGELTRREMQVVCLDANWEQIAQCGEVNLRGTAVPENIAYVIYTSGSTGNPKGVMIAHRNVINFCTAMDHAIGCESPGIWLAVTSISFDISVLELLWTVTRGFKVVIQGEQEGAPSILNTSMAANRSIDFSLFYFASDSAGDTKDLYKLLIEGAKFADQQGFSAIWTPERHFHSFGGLYPNPSVISAAIATITQQIQLRAGSVVLPLHNPIRVAEEWSVVDNISKGRVGISFASGWHADDFVLAQENYASRKEIMVREIETVRKLWRGESLRFRGGAGNYVDVNILPKPVQKDLPIWITAAGAPDTFLLAGQMGTGLLTHLLGQSLDELEEKIKIYRRAWSEHRHSPGNGHVTLMLHTFIGDDLDDVREKVRRPFCDYLRNSIGLIKNLARSLGHDLDSKNFTEDDMQTILSHAFDRYFQTSGLIGVPSTCMRMIEKLKAIGVDEVACLIDFGVDTDSVLKSLHSLNALRKWSNEKNTTTKSDYSITTQIARHKVSHLQCTPSLVKMMALESKFLNALGGLRKLLLGGEPVHAPLAQELKQRVSGDIHVMYGPTETTIWSTTDLVESPVDRISIGKPIANTEVYIVDRHLQPAPVIGPGELHIGGAGVVRGYLNSPDLTAEKFIPCSFGTNIGSRLYKTGDVARYLPDGRIEFLERTDHQVKIRGFRVELGEIEAALSSHPEVREAAVLAERGVDGEKRLAAYVVAESENFSGVNELRSFLRGKLPDFMMPSSFVILDSIPLTPNGKVNRRALLETERASPESLMTFVPPRNAVEDALAGIWADVLGLDQVGVHDDFFELGGHSLLASQLVFRLRETFDIEFPLRSFFQAPTVAGMAMTIFENPDQQMRVEKIAKLLIDIAQYSENEVEAMLNEVA
jgi:natural product biosynthesis luciferase-like monooxygenase protein